MRTRSHHALPGVPIALASAVLFGASTPLAKALLAELSPFMLAGLLYLGSGIGLFVLGRLVPRAGEAPLRRGDVPRLAAVVLAGGVAGPALLMLGLATTPASEASLLLNLEGVLTIAVAWLVFRENVDLKVGIGALAILAGAAVLSWNGAGGGTGWGAAAIAAACLAWAIDNNLTRGLAGSDPVAIAMIKGLAAGTVNVAIGLALAAHPVLPPAPAVAAAGLIGFLGYGVSLALFVLALRHLGTARTGAYFSLAPFVGASIGIVGLGEPVSWRFAAAAALMLFGLYLHLAERHEHPHEHEPLRHEHRHVHDEHHRHAHGPDDPEGEPHSHAHAHARMVHRHPHYPDLHHRHGHASKP
jgi:drug/metabolite transporter (DMT)-like permease